MSITDQTALIAVDLDNETLFRLADIPVLSIIPKEPGSISIRIG